MRTLTLTVDEAWNGSTVKHLLRARLHMAEGLIARVKPVSYTHLDVYKRQMSFCP